MDDITHQERLQRNPPTSGLSGILQGKEPEADRGVASCKAFGYHLGPEHLSAVELRFLSGDGMWFPYQRNGRLPAYSFRGAVAQVQRGPGLPRADSR